MNDRRKKFWLPFGWRLTVVYRPSPFAEMWGYRPLAIGLGFFSTLLLLRIAL